MSAADSNVLTLLAGRRGQSSSDDITKQADNLQHGLASLVLNLVETIIEVLERQAFGRFSSGTLTEGEIERLGIAFARMRERMAEMAAKFDYQPKALELSLNTGHQEILGSQETTDMQSTAISLADIVDKLIDKEAVLAGDIRLAVAGVDLVTLNLVASISSAFGSDAKSEDNQIVR